MTCCAGHTYTSLHAEGGNQGMLRICLLDKETSQVICVVTTHLKAKAGSKNDAIRNHQVGTLVFCCLYLPLLILASVTTSQKPTLITFLLSSRACRILCLCQLQLLHRGRRCVRTPLDML